MVFQELWKNSNLSLLGYPDLALVGLKANGPYSILHSVFENESFFLTEINEFVGGHP